MTNVALAVPPDDERRLVAEARHLGHTVVAVCSGADELAARVSVLRPEVALVTGSEQYLSAGLVAACDAAGVRLVVAASGPAEHRRAQRLGVHDAIEGRAGWEQIGPPALPPHPPHVTAPGLAVDAAPSRRAGTVIVVWGASGAPGRTSLAIGIAAELADAGLRVALGDADTHAASIAPSLGLLDEAPGFAAACRLAGAGAGALDDAQFQRIAHWHRSGHSGFWVLTGLGRPSRWPELSSERVEGAIRAARDWVDVLVLDTAAPLETDEELTSDVAAPRRNAATLAALHAADRVVTVAAADPVGLSRYLRAHAELLELVGPDRVVTVVNKVRSSAIGLHPQAQITQTLARFGGVVDPLLVPSDPFAFDAALLSGRTLLDVAPRSAARAAVRKLALERLRVPGAAAASVAPRRARPTRPSRLARPSRRGGDERRRHRG